MAYIGTQPKDVRSFGKAKFDFTATQGQTAFTGADDDGKTLGFTDGQINVYVNGILIDDSDYSTSGSNTVTLSAAANANDIISVVALQTDIPNSDYVPATGGGFTGDVGIGTTNPTNTYGPTLHIEGTNPNLRLDGTHSGSWAWISMNTADAGDDRAMGTASNGSFRITNVRDDLDSGIQFAIQQDGKVGIGTSSPVSKLTVENAQGDTLGAAVSVRGSGGYDAIIEVENTTPTNGGKGFLLATDDTWSIGANKVAIGYGSPASSNTAVAIDASKRVTMPYQPAFDVGLTSGAVTSGTVLFNNVRLNKGSHYSSSTGRFTAPVTGLYEFYWGGIKSGLTAVTRAVLHRNGAGVRENRLAEGDSYNAACWIMLLELNANDYVEIQITAGTYYGQSDYYGNAFGGRLIG